MLFAAGVRFQSTLPRVERPLYSRYRPAPSHFNPRSREWSDGTKMFILFFVIIFQSTLPRVERLSSDFLLFTLSRFQSTLPRVERPLLTQQQQAVYKFQSTLPRVERLVSHNKTFILLTISIHAPASGATAFIDIFSFTVRLYFISSH